ncbi:Pectin lyase-like superfamily protein [Euphorbia peplus]|nr:Pectin lyase-like superfamily protein [Euphorbia peplus]
MEKEQSCFWLCEAQIVTLCTFWCKASDCQTNNKNQTTITVDKSGHGKFTTIQSAINSIPEGNSHWIHILISPGIYREKVTISVKKPCIFLEGASMNSTIIDWADFATTGTSATFTSYSDNILVKSITFKNSYNYGMRKYTKYLRGEETSLKQAVAARIKGDKTTFYNCGFLGVQDTLWDEKNRHFFKDCYIEGSIDFIFGKGQSIYQGCKISVNVGKYVPGGLIGSITAQKREWESHQSGFVFKDCEIDGSGRAYLGRAWGPYSTVIFHNTSMSSVIVPQGWNAWNYAKHEANLTYVEDNNRGVGAKVANRVPWMKKLGANELKEFLDISYINQDLWLADLPFTVI